MERLAKYIARCGITSRRKAEDLIRDGDVRINGCLITELSTKVDPLHDAVKVNNKLIRKPCFKYVLFHKPKRVITTKSDSYGRKTVIDLLPKYLKDLHPVGRLDKDTTGLLLLTNDGELTYRLTHPRYGVPKTYNVHIRGDITLPHIERIRTGIRLEDGLTQPARVTTQRGKQHTTFLTIAIKEGRKRQIRRMIEILGYKVLTLQRTAVGSLQIGNLTEGEYRHLQEKEVLRLKRDCKMNGKS
ncbi:MAG: rRNA pseudouridine synthase [Candidatus Omnitrophica bacterium]|nr:rRNA pseudouridine synthase [Candidatus Omnitrophota bacterium]